jgi:hypothetical protein
LRWTTPVGLYARLGSLLNRPWDLTTPFGLAAPLTLPPTLRLAILSDGVEVVLCVAVKIVWVAKSDGIDVLRESCWWVGNSWRCQGVATYTWKLVNDIWKISSNNAFHVICEMVGALLMV